MRLRIWLLVQEIGIVSNCCANDAGAMQDRSENRVARDLTAAIESQNVIALVRIVPVGLILIPTLGEVVQTVRERGPWLRSLKGCPAPRDEAK